MVRVSFGDNNKSENNTTGNYPVCFCGRERERERAVR